MSGIPCPPKWTVAKSVINPEWVDWHAEIHAGLRAVCVMCGKAFEHHELTTSGACSYLCLGCADTVEQQMNDPAWRAENGPKG